jgi:hypothetical protein
VNGPGDPMTVRRRQIIVLGCAWMVSGRARPFELPSRSRLVLNLRADTVIE